MSNSVEHANETAENAQGSDDSYVEYAYRTALGRSADAQGLASWLQELQSGHLNRAGLLRALEASAEGQEHARTVGSSTGSTSSGDDSFVEYAYQAVLGRSADAPGRAHWLQELQAGHVDRTTLLNALASSVEGLHHAQEITHSAHEIHDLHDSNELNDDSYVDYAYQTMLGRAADAAGQAHWVQELESHHIDRNGLLNALASSEEGHTHQLSLIGVSDVPATA